MIKMAPLGAGRIGQVHGGAITMVPGATLVAVADAFPKAAQDIADKYGCDVRTIDEIADSKDVDAVLICTPTDTHADLIEQFSAAKKAIFCEKPIDLNIDCVRSCLDTVKKNKGKLMLGFNRRFDPDFMALHDAVASGKIGSVEMVTITSRDPGAPPADYISRSGGIFRDMTIHDFDIARWILGEEIETVSATASVLTDPAIGELGDFDSANIMLRTASGKLATITNSRRAAYGYDQRIEVLGSLGSVTANNTHEANIEIATESGMNKPPLLNFFMTRYTAAYANEIAAFVDGLVKKTEFPTTGYDGMMALALAEAAVKSVHEGRSVKVEDI